MQPKNTKNAHRNCKKSHKKCQKWYIGDNRYIARSFTYWLFLIASFHHIGYPRYYRDILESVPVLTLYNVLRTIEWIPRVIPSSNKMTFSLWLSFAINHVQSTFACASCYCVRQSRGCHLWCMTRGLTNPGSGVWGESVLLLVLNSVTSTLQWIRQTEDTPTTLSEINLTG